MQTIEHYLNDMPNTHTQETPVLLFKGTMPERPWKTIDVRSHEEIMHRVNERIQIKADRYLIKINIGVVS